MGNGVTALETECILLASGIKVSHLQTALKSSDLQSTEIVMIWKLASAHLLQLNMMSRVSNSLILETSSAQQSLSLSEKWSNRRTGTNAKVR